MSSTSRRGFLGLLAGATALPLAKLPALEPEIAIEQVPIYHGALGEYCGVVIRTTNKLLTKHASIWRDEVIKEYRANTSFERYILPNRSA